MRNERATFDSHAPSATMSNCCPTCHQLMPVHRLVSSDFKREPVMESLPIDYDSCQLGRLSESTRTIPVITEHKEE